MRHILIFFFSVLQAYAFDISSIESPVFTNQPLLDIANTLTQEEFQAMNAKIKLVRSRSEIDYYTVILPTTEDTTSKMASKLFKKWQIPSHGILIFIIMDKREIEIEFGDSVQTKFSNTQISKLIKHEARLLLKNNDTFEAINHILNILKTIETSSILVTKTQNLNSDGFISLITDMNNDGLSIIRNIALFIPVLMLVLPIVFLFLFYRSFSKKMNTHLKMTHEALGNLGNGQDFKKNIFKTLNNFEKMPNLEVQSKIAIREKNLNIVDQNIKIEIFIIIGLYLAGLFWGFYNFVPFGKFFTGWFLVSTLYLILITKKNLELSQFIIGKNNQLLKSPVFTLFHLPIIIGLILARIRVLSKKKKFTEKLKALGFEFITENEEDIHLTKSQRFEESIGSVEYDVYKKDDELKVLKRIIPSLYSECSSCGTVANKKIRDDKISKPTKYKKGKRRMTYKCLLCGEVSNIEQEIPKLKS